MFVAMVEIYYVEACEFWNAFPLCVGTDVEKMKEFINQHPIVQSERTEIDWHSAYSPKAIGNCYFMNTDNDRMGIEIKIEEIEVVE